MGKIKEKLEGIVDFFSDSENYTGFVATALGLGFTAASIGLGYGAYECFSHLSNPTRAIGISEGIACGIGSLGTIGLALSMYAEAYKEFIGN